MNKVVLLALCLALGACSTNGVPVGEKFPGIEPEFMVPAPVLKTIPAGTPASGVFDIVVDNYATYHDIAAQLKGWQDWYVKQQTIFDDLNKKTSNK